jgi:hypothetical protein
MSIASAAIPGERAVRRRRRLTLLLVLTVIAAPATAAVITAGESDPLVLALEPVDLPAHALHDEVEQPRPLATTLDRSGWIRGFTLSIEDLAGRAVPQTLLHHVKLLIPDRRDLFSPAMRHLLAAGSETESLLLPALFGYRVEAGDSVLLSGMVHNPTDTAWQGVRIRLQVEYMSDEEWPEPIDVLPFFMHVTEPGTPSHYDLPPGRSQRSWDMQPAVPGRILGVGGHIHRYGTGLRIEDVTAGIVIWDAKTQLDAEGNVLEVPRSYFVLRTGVPIYTDHVYRVTAFYDNPGADTLRDGGMGAVAGIILPDRDAAYPAIDRSNPVYLRQAAGEYGRWWPGADSTSHHHH